MNPLRDIFGALGVSKPRALGAPSLDESGFGDTPESLAAAAAAQGIPPPPLGVPQGFPGTLDGASDGGGRIPSWAAGTGMPGGGSFGAALDPVAGPSPMAMSTSTPMPVAAQDPNAGITTGPTLEQAGKAGGSSMPNMQNALRGVQAPPAPSVQRISTPNAPRPTGQIKGGDLQQLLLMLQGAGGQTLDRKLPSTLGAAIGR